MKAFPNRDLASLPAVPSISQSCGRRSISCGIVSSSTETGGYRRNGKKRRFQRRLSRGSYPSSESLSRTPMDQISLNPRSCNETHTLINQEYFQCSPSLVDSSGATFALSVHRASHLNADFADPYTHILQGYDPNARHFDGLLGASSDDFLIDLDTDSMERLPDVRVFFFYVGYEASHASRRDEPMNSSDREQEYVRAGRLALLAKKESGHGLFLQPPDWVAMREDHSEPCAWMEHVNSFIYGVVGEGEALGHSGAWDVVLTDFDEWALGTYPATNVRAPLFPQHQMLIGPGHPDWTRLVVDFYYNHPLTLLKYTTMERLSCIRRRSTCTGRKKKWCTEEAVQLYNHHVCSDYSPGGCVHCVSDPEEYR